MTRLAPRSDIPSPKPTPESDVFWNGAAAGRFLLNYCTSCREAHWPPRAFCPFCCSGQTGFREASGRGTIYSFSVMRRAPEAYVVAYVTLAEGPTMLTNLVECDVDRLAIGQAVQVRFVPTQGGPPVPMFAPVDSTP